MQKDNTLNRSWRFGSVPKGGRNMSKPKAEVVKILDMFGAEVERNLVKKGFGANVVMSVVLGSKYAVLSRLCKQPKEGETK